MNLTTGKNMTSAQLLLEDRRFYVYVYMNYLFSGDYTYQESGKIIHTFLYRPFYFGKGQGNRMYYHLKEDYHYRCNKLKIDTIKFLQDFINPFVFKVKEHLTQEEAYDYENKLINYFGTLYDNTGCLTNIIKQKGKQPRYKKITPWNKGLRKEDSLSLQRGAEKMKKTKKERKHPSPMKGRIHPNPHKAFRENHSRWIDLDINKCIHLYFTNRTISQIAEEIGCSKSPIHRLYNDINLPKGAQRIKGEVQKKKKFIQDFGNKLDLFYIRDNEKSDDYFFRVRSIIFNWEKEFDHDRRKQYSNGDFDVSDIQKI
jgi:hypothetical protein